MTNAYVIDESSIKLPKEVLQKLKLKKGMELKVLSVEDGSILLLKTNESIPKKFLDIKGIGREVWSNIDAQEYTSKEREEWR
ncbi:UNVERIFIED_CONTAM: hypothetical protein Cloal_1816 [Acetivibrio alkalicellulosi]